MRRMWILLAIVAMIGALLAAPGTALAKGKPPKPPSGALYNVTLDRVTIDGSLADGMATECGPLVMRGTLNGTTLNLMADGTEGSSVPMIYLQTSMVGYRYFPDDDRNPETTSEVSFTGCHGGSPWYSIEDPFYEDGALINHPGVLMVAIDGDTITFGVWHFDYWWEETSATHGKKTVSDIDVVEHFSMHADPITMTDWNGANGIGTGTATGTFGITYFLTDTHTGVYIPKEPVAGSPEALTFTITVTPQEP
jgi:hypothetical protein